MPTPIRRRSGVQRKSGQAKSANQIPTKGPIARICSVLVKLNAGKTIDDVGQWAMTMVGPPPGDLRGGITGILPGAHAYLVTDLIRSTWSFWVIGVGSIVLEGPGAVGALGDRPVPSSAAVSHHRHPNRNSTTTI